MTATSPVGPTITGLIEVSCPTTTFCGAIGAIDGGSVFATWNGGAWTVVGQGASGPTYQQNFEHVSCASATRCFVSWSEADDDFVGFWYGVEVWDGTAFTSALYMTDQLPVVSCSGATFCLLADATHSWRWNGTSLTPGPARAFSFVTSMSCASSTFCMLVQSTTSPGGGGEQASMWNGSAFHDLPVPPSPPDGTVRYQDVACASAGSCVLVGLVARNHDPFYGPAVAARWDGTAVATAVLPSTAVGDLTGVSCPSTIACVAMHVPAPYTPAAAPRSFAFNGVQWYEASTPPAPGTTNAYNDIDCVDGTEWCMAVGTRVTGANRTSLSAVYHWTDPS